MKTVTAFIGAWNQIPVLAEIMRILETKKFTDPGKPKHFDQPVIGVMSPLVRAMYTFLDDNAKALTAAKESTIIALPISCPGLGLDCLGKLAMEADICPHAPALLKVKASNPLAVHQDFIRGLMFSLIEDATPDHGEDLPDVSLAENFLITTSKKPKAYPDMFETFQGWESMTVEELVAISIKDTFMEPLAEILENDQFVDIDEPVSADEVIVRSMNPLEKALISRINLLTQGMLAKQEEHNNLLNGENFIKESGPKIDFSSLGPLGAIISIDMSDDNQEYRFEPKDPSHPDCIRVKELEKEFKAVQEAVKPYQAIHWPLIKMNVDSEKTDNFDGLGIRHGFQIVAMNEPAEVE